MVGEKSRGDQHNGMAARSRIVYFCQVLFVFSLFFLFFFFFFFCLEVHLLLEIV